MPDKELEDFMKSIGSAPATVKGSSSSNTGAPTSFKEEAEAAGSYLDPHFAAHVGKGLAKSGAGTITGIPRAINWGISFASPQLSSTLGDLAERVPGVKSMEEFAASKNETWGESLGYWGGEGAQFFGPGLVAKAAKIPKAIEAAKVAEEAFSAGKFTKGAGFAPEGEKALAEGVVSKEPMSLPGKFSTTKAGPWGEVAGEGFRPTAMSDLERIAREETAARNAKLGTETVPKYKSPGRRVGEAVLKGGVAGAMTDPNDPGPGALAGAATGGAVPLSGAILRSGAGQYIAGHAGRYAAASGIMAVGHALGIPAHWLWTIGLPALVERWHSPTARTIARAGQKGARKIARGARRTPGSIPGAITGTGLNELQTPRDYEDEGVIEKEAPDGR